MPRCAARESGIDRLRDVVDMNAIEDLARLDDAARFAACDLNQRILSRPVNAGEPKDARPRRRGVRRILPGLLGGKPRHARAPNPAWPRRLRPPRRRRSRRKRRPSKDRRSTADAACAHTSSPNAASTGSPFSIWRIETSAASASPTALVQLRRRRFAVEHDRLQPPGKRVRSELRRARRCAPCRPSGRSHRRTAAMKCSARIAKPETKQHWHRHAHLAARPSHSSITCGSVFAAAPRLRRIARAAPRSSRPSAQTAAPRTSGEASSSSRSASSASLALAGVADRDQHIAQKRARPMRLTATLG